MPESAVQGPGGYAEVRGTAGTPHPQEPDTGHPQVADPFKPPDVSKLGPGPAAGGTTGPGGNHGGGLANLISGGGKIMDMLPEVAEVAAL